MAEYSEERLDDVRTRDRVVDMMARRGVELEEIAALTYALQGERIPELTEAICLEHVERVVMKREVQNAILTGLELDRLAESNHVNEPLRSMLMDDYGLYGVDEVLALAIVNVYGSIGFTNFGYVDKLKPGVIARIDEEGKREDRCNTFLDDIVGAIASAAASSIAHRYG